MTKLATTAEKLGGGGQAAAICAEIAEIAEVDRRLDTLLDDEPD